ncbi:RDD family protein [Oxalobacteraceae bacterium OTU3REALA1]|nr:RDD family protein [Oxalobacteraceae bacterium OTU3REALA1]
MAFSTQNIRENYERMDTEELLSFACKDLTDIASEVLNDVLVARGVSLETIDKARAGRVEIMSKEFVRHERLAPILSRLVAFGIDFLGVAAAIYIILLPLKIFSDALHQTVLLIVFWAYFLFRDGIPGQGVGKRLMSLRTEQLTGGSASFVNSFWRNLMHFFFVIDALFALGKRRMRLGDMIAGTHVVRK